MSGDATGPLSDSASSWQPKSYERCTDPDCPDAYAYRDPFPTVEHYHPLPHGPQLWATDLLSHRETPTDERFDTIEQAEQEARRRNQDNRQRGVPTVWHARSDDDDQIADLVKRVDWERFGLIDNDEP